MWKKEDGPDAAAAPRPQTQPVADRTVPLKASGERATIGRSITINGEVSGDEDLLIQGRVDGSVNLKQHSVTVGPDGVVKANITARIVTVEGNVQGNLKAEEQVILRNSAVVEGDVAAPRVVLEDGARFRGGVDMGESHDRNSRHASAQRGATETGRSAYGTAAPSTAPDTSASADDARAAAGAKGGAAHSAAPVSR